MVLRTLFHPRVTVFLAFLIFLLTQRSHVAAQSRGPGPRAGHCVVEHGNVLYFLGGTPPTSTKYAAFTSLKLPLNSVSTADPESFPWADLPTPPVPVEITNLTMTFNNLAATATPAWIDCFATDDGRIVVVGGSFQLLVYTIGSSSWDTSTVSSFKYGPLVSSGMFLNPIYIQSRILADGYTALVVCTLTWNSQPQPYYLDTRSWTVTLAIGTAETTPVASERSNGWGAIPGVTTLAPPAGLRHFTLAILGQDKDQPKKYYGNGRAYILGGYSTLVTGQVQDWAVVTSFPVQQAPSNVVVMFGNAGTLPKGTRGSVAYPISSGSLAFFPGNGGASGNVQQVQEYDVSQNAASVLDVSGGPKNTIFRGATLIGQGKQIFVHGGLTSLEFGTQPMSSFLDQSMSVYNGDSRSWGDTVNIFTPPKSKALMIGLIVGGIVLLAFIGGGFWYYKRRQRIRQTEEEERKMKGMALKNEDKLHKDDSHKGIRKTIDDYRGNGYYEPLHPPHQNFGGSFTPGRESVDWQQSSTNVNRSYVGTEATDEIVPMHQYSPQMSQISDGTRVVHSPQEYPANSAGTSPHQYKVTAPTGYNVYVEQAYQASQATYARPMPELIDDPASTHSQQGAVGMDPSASRPSLSQDAYYGARPYSSISTLSNNHPDMTPHMSSPAFSATYSQGSDQGVQRPLLGSDPAPGDSQAYHSFQRHQ
ncbi:hypothetical protein CPC16_010435 [Podila verticillata]|nr:hypothetical protein CPC16_010435 [Podila verticillata]